MSMLRTRACALTSATIPCQSPSLRTMPGPKMLTLVKQSKLSGSSMLGHDMDGLVWVRNQSHNYNPHFPESKQPVQQHSSRHGHSPYVKAPVEGKK